MQGRAMDQGLEIVEARDDSTVPLSTFYQALARLWHQTDSRLQLHLHHRSESDVGKSQGFSEPQFTHLQNGITYTQVARMVE